MERFFIWVSEKLTWKVSLLFAFVLCLGVQFYDLELRSSNPKGTYGILSPGIAYSPDSKDYLEFVDNYFEGAGFKVSVPGVGSYFYRTPGYSLVYLVFRTFFERENSLIAVRILQTFLFLFSIYFFYTSSKSLMSEHWARSITFIYSVVPCFYSYTFFFLTEGLTGVLLVFSFYLVIKMKGYQDVRRQIFAGICVSLILGYLTLVRPPLGIFMFGFGLHVLIHFYKVFNSFFLSIKKTFQVCIPFVIVLFLWSSWICYKTGNIVLLNKYTHPTTAQFYKLPTWGLWAVGQVWGEDGVDFNNYAIPMYEAAIEGDTSIVYVDATVSAWVAEYPQIKELGLDRLYDAVRNYQTAMYSQKEYLDNKTSMPEIYLPVETRAYDALIAIRDDLKADAPFIYYVNAPLIYLSKLVFNSGTSNLYFFQEPFRDNKLINFLRYILLGFNVILYAGLFINLFRWRKIHQYIYIVLIPIVYIIVLCWFFRSVEQRYMYPVYPFLLIGLGSLFQAMMNRKFSKYGI